MPEEPIKDPSPINPPSSAARRHRLSLIVLAVASPALLTLVLGSRATAINSLETQQPGPDYSRFTHANPAHARLPCLLCHRRENNSPQAVRSIGHTPCAGCHSQQFAAQAGPICTNCHTGVGSAKPEVKPFPALKSFNVRFDHARHASAGCATCHRPVRRGVALSIPAGLGAHTTCFRCHAPRAQANGRDISSCGVCHQPGRYARTPESARAYRVNFSHAEHARQRLSCKDCHAVRAGLPQGRQVTSPAPTQHFGSARVQSCMTCHNNERAFGGDDFSDCKRCHQGPTFRF